MDGSSSIVALIRGRNIATEAAIQFLPLVVFCFSLQTRMARFCHVYDS